MKGDLTKLIKDQQAHPTLVDMTNDGFINVETEGEYYIMVNEQGIIRYYNPSTDTVLPFIERGEKYGEGRDYTN